jgi:DNA-binding SARP family transcriptional activator
VSDDVAPDGASPADVDMDIDFRLLGPVEAYVGSERIDIGYPMHRLMLALLLAAKGRSVSVEWLMDQMWGEQLPKTARDLIYGYISDLRTFLSRGREGGGELLPQHNGGYRVQVELDHVDACRFEDLVKRGRRLAGQNDAEAVQLLRAALDQWGTSIGGIRGGEPLAGLPGPWAAEFRTSLEQQRLSALVDCMEAELRLGHHNEIIPELAELVGSNPANEQLAAILMRAQYQVGRQADAMGTYQRIRRHLVEVYGAEPSVPLQGLLRRILDQDPTLTMQGPPASSPTPAEDDGSDESTGSSNTPREQSGSDRTPDAECGKQAGESPDRHHTTVTNKLRNVKIRSAVFGIVKGPGIDD